MRDLANAASTNLSVETDRDKNSPKGMALYWFPAHLSRLDTAFHGVVQAWDAWFSPSSFDAPASCIGVWTMHNKIAGAEKGRIKRRDAVPTAVFFYVCQGGSHGRAIHSFHGPSPSFRWSGALLDFTVHLGNCQVHDLGLRLFKPPQVGI